MNNQELLQQRRIVGWYGEEPEYLDDEKVQDVFCGIQEKFHAVIAQERGDELAPERADEEMKRVRVKRILRVMAGESIRDVAKSEHVRTVAVTDMVKYGITRLAMLQVDPLSCTNLTDVIVSDYID